MTLTNQIKEKIAQGFHPAHFELVNESHKHKGHAGDNGSGESHFKLIVVSDRFENFSRIQRHRMVFDVLKDHIGQEDGCGIHALSLKLLTSSEHKKL